MFMKWYQVDFLSIFSNILTVPEIAPAVKLSVSVICDDPLVSNTWDFILSYPNQYNAEIKKFFLIHMYQIMTSF